MLCWLTSWVTKNKIFGLSQHHRTWRTSKQTNVTLNDFWEQKISFFFNKLLEVLPLVWAANELRAAEVEGSGEVTEQKMWWKKVNVRENGRNWKRVIDEKRENRSVGERRCVGGREGGGTEGRFSKNRTGQCATIQPPFSLSISIFQSCSVGKERERDGNPFPNWRAELAELVEWLIRLVSVETNHKELGDQKVASRTPKGVRWLPPMLC